ncbi:hypothetical protein D3C85_1278070 [compost metagenome]
MPVIVDLQSTFGTVVAVEPGVHGHGIEIRAGAIDQGPVNAKAVALQLDVAGALACEALIETVDIALQAAVADEETAALGLPTRQL